MKKPTLLSPSRAGDLLIIILFLAGNEGDMSLCKNIISVKSPTSIKLKGKPFNHSNIRGDR
jgi:hypothetical protein